MGLIINVACGQADLKKRFDKGVNLVMDGKYEKAIVIFSDILQKASDNDLKKSCYIYRGLAYNGLQEFKSELADLDKAIAIDSTDLATYVDRGQTNASLTDLEEAKKDFLHVLSKDSISEQGQAALYYMGKINYQLGKFELAIHYNTRLLSIKPNDIEVYFNRGCAKGMLLDFAGAIKDYDKATELNADYAEAYANRGVAKINLVTVKGKIQPTPEQTADGCKDLKKARDLGDKAVDDLIFIYCRKK